MFQNVWFNRKKYIKSHSANPNNLPPDFIITDKIKYIRPIFYDEHCLECSAPACYKSCPHYIKRKDSACVRLDYGIKHLKSNELLWNVKVKFRGWGKLEARINKGSLPVKKLHALNNRDKFVTNCFKLFCSVFQPNTYSFNQKFDGLRRKKYAEIHQASTFVNDFLFQYYYGGEKQFNLFFEITDKDNSVIYKTAFNIGHGYGQEILKLDFPLPEGGLVRLFPENNLTEELQIFAADFVQFNSTVPSVPNKKIKCVAWDLDNTVWDGILIEANPEELKLRKDVLDTIKELDKRGIIQIIISKNDRENVLPVLERLEIKDYFVYVFANWNAKSSNLFYAARKLNINIDTFALIDDSAFERSEVSTTLPCVRVYDENSLSTLVSLPEFDSPITDESAHRRLSYIQEISRKQIQNEFMGDNTAFIKSCELIITISHIKTQTEFDRSLELIKRTNQLNLSARRYSEEEFKELLDKTSGNALIIYAKDNFGDYGQVAFIYLSEQCDRILITEFAMSCRVAAKYVENALFSLLRDKYKKEIRLYGIKTDRNGVLVSSLLKAGFRDESDAQNISLILKADEVIKNSDIVKTDFKK